MWKWSIYLMKWGILVVLCFAFGCEKYNSYPGNYSQVASYSRADPDVIAAKKLLKEKQMLVDEDTQLELEVKILFFDIDYFDNVTEPTFVLTLNAQERELYHDIKEAYSGPNEVIIMLAQKAESIYPEEKFTRLIQINKILFEQSNRCTDLKERINAHTIKVFDFNRRYVAKEKIIVSDLLQGMDRFKPEIIIP